jgi:hypothetical protein
LVLHTTQQCVAPLSCPGRSAARSDALQTRDRHGPWQSQPATVPDQRCITSLTLALHRIRDTSLGRVRSLIHFSNSPDLLVPAARFCARVLHRCFANPNRGVGGAPRNVRVLSGTPVGRIMCVKDARERAYDAIRQALARRLASHDAGRSPLGAPPWRFWAPGAALPSPSAPAVLQRRAGALRIRAASSSHPGRSAWRAGSLPPEANGYEPPPQDATPRSAFRIVSRTRPQ